MLREAARGVLGGAVGTAAMSLAAHHRRRRYVRRHGVAPEDVGAILDYDDSDHVVVAASTLLRLVIGRAPHSPRGRRALFLLVHWGYGSAVGVAHVALRHALRREPAAGLVFLAGSQAMALALFPVLGETPPPWRWERRLLVTSVVQHAIYAGTVAAVNTATASCSAREAANVRFAASMRAKSPFAAPRRRRSPKGRSRATGRGAERSGPR